MNREDFSKLFSENPSSDDVMAEINRLYDFEQTMTERLPAIESERDEYKQKYSEANERYIKRFLTGKDDEETPKPVEDKEKITIDDLFKEV